MGLTLEESIFFPDQSSDSEEKSSELEAEEPSEQYPRRKHLNRFLESCNIAKLKRWEEAGARTRRNHVKKAKDVIVAALDVIAPGDAALLWDAVQLSMPVEKELGSEESVDRKYLNALAETYKHASSWDTRRQVLSIMADLVPFKRLQRYLPGVTEYRVKMARQHKHAFGRGVPLLSKSSPRMRVDSNQLDHFLTFITSPHIVQDLPFGQKYIKLSTGEVLETFNVIRSMIPERIIMQYTEYCEVSWKAHQLRNKRQDMARIAVIDHLETSSVMITQDWAMKFLPQKYRESQTDWFAKRGISWHISVVARRHHEKLQSQSFVHTVENCNQDSSVVICIMEHILRTLKKETRNSLQPFLGRTMPDVIIIRLCWLHAVPWKLSLESLFLGWTLATLKEGRARANAKQPPSKHMCEDL